MPLASGVGPTRRLRADSDRAGARGIRVLSVLCLALIALLVFPSLAAAVPPSPQLRERAAADELLAARLSRLAERQQTAGVDAGAAAAAGLLAEPSSAGALSGAAASSPVQRAAPATGDLATLVLLVDFRDAPGTLAPGWFDDFFFADVFGPTSVRGYFREISYGTLATRGALDVVTSDLPSASGWVRLPQPLSFYVSGGDNGTGSYPGNAQRMVEDAVAAADPLIDFSAYDSNGDGFVDNLFVVHAGRGAELTGQAGDVWSHQWQTTRPVFADGVSVLTYSTEPEYWRTPGDMTVGVYAHEMCHVLGLVDLYDRDFTSSGVGEWSLMGSGSWNGHDGDSPARLDAWSAARLGWLRPRTVAEPPAEVALEEVAASATVSAVKIYPDGRSGGPEYFLVENRQQTGTDAALPGAGLLVWHVDERLLGEDYLNDDEEHKLVDLEEAGGAQDLDTPWAFAGPEDPFPGSADARAFSDGTSPSARTYDGSNSGVKVLDVSASGAVMTARIGVGAPGDGLAPTLAIAGASDGAAYRSEVAVALTAADEVGGSGVAAIRYTLDGGARQIVAAATAEVRVPAVPNGLHVLTARAADVAGNESPPATVTFVTDTRGPVGYGRDASGRRGRAVTLKYKFGDALSPTVQNVRLVVRSSAGAIVRTVHVAAMRATGRWYAAKWTPKRAGTYRYWVYGRDEAGNAQAILGRGTIRVR